jgi:hypothetical protein
MQSDMLSFTPLHCSIRRAFNHLFNFFCACLQLADAYYRRSQCRQLLASIPGASSTGSITSAERHVESDAAKSHAMQVLLPAALQDAKKAVKLCPEDVSVLNVMLLE